MRVPPSRDRSKKMASHEGDKIHSKYSWWDQSFLVLTDLQEPCTQHAETKRAMSSCRSYIIEASPNYQRQNIKAFQISRQSLYCSFILSHRSSFTPTAVSAIRSTRHLACILLDIIRIVKLFATFTDTFALSTIVLPGEPKKPKKHRILSAPSPIASHHNGHSLESSLYTKLHDAALSTPAAYRVGSTLSQANRKHQHPPDKGSRWRGSRQADR